MNQPDARLTEADAQRLIRTHAHLLNQRQRDALAHHLTGHTRRQTAHLMQLSPSTIQAHLDNALRILHDAWQKERNA